MTEPNHNLKMSDYKLQRTAYVKRCQRRIYKRSDQPKKCVKTVDCKADQCLNVQAGLVQPQLLFAFRDANRETLVFLRTETRNVATRVSVHKQVQSTELDIVNESFQLQIYVRWLLEWRYISSLQSADESQEERNSCPLLRSYLSYRFQSCWCLETFFTQYQPCSLPSLLQEQRLRRFAYLENFNLNFSSSSLVIRVNLLHS